MEESRHSLNGRQSISVALGELLSNASGAAGIDYTNMYDDAGIEQHVDKQPA